MPSKVYYKVSELDFSLEQLPERKEPLKVLLCTPDYFEVVDVKNPYMKDNLNKTNKNKALQQWMALKDIYLGLVEQKALQQCIEIEGAEGCEDMVFAANQSFPWLGDKEKKVVVLSKMRHSARQKEVRFFEKFYKKTGYETLELKRAQLFEGMGDTIPHPGKRLLYGGFGHRTEPGAYEEISQLLEVNIIALELVSEKYYHLDTCFLPLSADKVLICESAFSKTALDLIKKLFKEVIIASEREAEQFALNAHIIISGAKKYAIIQQGLPVTNNLLRAEGFEVVETDTSEYIKSGGSVFCMKMMIY
jgi:N-dimethylarginine dimethylaminohydrolase